MNIGKNLKTAKTIGKIARSVEGRAQRSRICTEAWKDKKIRRKRLLGIRKSRKIGSSYWIQWKKTRKERNWSAVVKDGYASGRRDVPVRYNHPRYRGISFRSLWEVAFAKWLDKRGELWEYELHRFYFREIDSVYIPDFYLPRLKLFVEVKGRQLDGFGNKLISFVKENGRKKIVVLFQKDLIRLGLLTNNGIVK